MGWRRAESVLRSPDGTAGVRWPDGLPRLSFDRTSIQAVDRDAIEQYAIPGIVLMENAARGLADVTAEVAGGQGARVVILCGRGNNGGDGYALARHLHNRGLRPTLMPLGTPRPGGDAGTNEAICRAMGLAMVEEPPGDDAEMDLLVDAIFGTGLDRPVRGESARWIDWLNARHERVLAVDVPSGLDCETGEPMGHAVRADWTVTFVGLKHGFLVPGAERYLGRIVVADIGAPIELYRRHGRSVDA